MNDNLPESKTNPVPGPRDALLWAHKGMERAGFQNPAAMGIFAAIQAGADKRTQAEARIQSLVPDDTLQTVHNMQNAFMRMDGIPSEETSRDQFHALIENIKSKAASQSPADLAAIREIAQLTALDSLVLNAQHYAEMEQRPDSLRQKFTALLREQLAGKEGEALEEAVGELSETVQKKLQISLTHTAHPTIYHTDEARGFEKALIQAFATGASEEEITAQIADFAAKMKTGEVSITPTRPTTVGMELQREQEIQRDLAERVHAVTAAWKSAVEEVSTGENAIPLTEKHKEALQLGAKSIQLRSWSWAGADADGREKATSQFMNESIQSSLADGEYKGPVLDLRQNARVHQGLFSALVQVKHRNADPGRTKTAPGTNGNGHHDTRRYGEDAQTGAKSRKHFDEFCEEFMREKQEGSHRNFYRENGWNGPRNSLFQQLHEDDRADFVTQTIRENFRLIPEQLTTDVLEFNETIYPLKQKFLARYDEEIRAHGYDPKILSYEEMIGITVKDKDRNGEGPNVSLRALWDREVKRNGWELKHRGLQYNRLIEETPEQMQVNNLLQGTRSLAQGEIKELTEQDRATYADTAKRLILINDAIKNHGSQVATRHEIANFSEASDFLILLKLFIDTGIAKYNAETQEIEETKLGIMPLLETREDMKNAEKIFKKLLKNPVALSFWKARAKAVQEEGTTLKEGATGYADIMVGFSDGAASGGSFASQWEIYDVMQKLTALFAEEGIEVHFKQGRGRGTSRGGTDDPSLQFDLLPQEVTKTGHYDATIQSDLPMDLANAPGYGTDYLGGLVLGAVSAALAPEKTPEEKERDRKAELIIADIANQAAESYNQKVRKNPEALNYFNGLPLNPFKSSRATVRGGAKKITDFDNTRAVDKEHFLLGTGLNAYNVGLGEALAAKQEQLTEIGQHSFFNAMMKIVDAGMGLHDPVIAKEYGKATKSEAFVGSMEESFRELDKHLRRFRSDGHTRTPASHTPGEYELAASALAQTGHAIMLGGMQAGLPSRPNPAFEEYKDWYPAVINALFAGVQPIGHFALPERARETPQKAAGIGR